MAIVRRKCFVSYHHADQNEVNQFILDFDHQRDTFIARGLGQEMTPDIINSTDTDYVMRRIRELFLRDSSVTIVMLGRCTWARRYVDWEIQASLRHGQTAIPNGLLAIKLPSFPENGHFPERLDANLTSEADRQAGMHYRYAAHMQYPQSSQALADAIEAAYQRRTTHAANIVNQRDRFSYNKQCV